jgi:SynChlorMet cassette radical SAM/SPASM protein ScmF
MLSRNPQFSLHSWDRKSGFALLTARDRSETLVLSPLALMAFTFSDGPFTRGEASRALAAHASDDSHALRASLDRVLDAMVEHAVLVDEAKPARMVPVAAEVPPLHSVYLYITYRCNLRCYHCYQRPEYAAFTHADRRDELPAAVLVEGIRKALPLGVRSVKITGGEPFLRPDTDDLVEGLAALGLHLTMETNGTMIGPERARRLARCGVGVSVSIDGSTADQHDRLRGVHGAFDRTVKGIRHLLDSGAEVKVITAVSRRNLHDIERICATVRDLGVTQMKINPVNTLGVAGVSGIDDDLLSPVEVLNMYGELRALRLEERYGVSLFLEGPPAFFTLEEIARARCGSCPYLNILGVLSNGEISFCGIGYTEPSLRFGSLCDADLTSLWHKHEVLRAARLAIPASVGGICERCALLPRCRGSCRAIAYQQEHSFTSPHPWCQELADNGLFPEQYLLAD